MNSEAILKSLKMRPFRPLALFRGGWQQTIAARYWPQKPGPELEHTHILRLTDGDQIVLIENAFKPLEPEARTMVLIHGLTGCHESNYMARLSQKLTGLGYKVIRMNLRGCGPGVGLAKNPYHSGRSEDLRAVLNYLYKITPNSPVTVIGFSLGANIALKMAGEDSLNPTGRLDSLIAVSPPADLAKSSKHMAQEQNRFFDQYFVKQLIKDVDLLHRYFPDLRPPQWPQRLSLSEFDDIYTAPRGGFKNAQDYYARSSSAPLIERIQVPTLILSSLDDPVVDSQSLKALSPPSHIEVLLTEKGGHVGFLGWTGTSFRWMDEVILAWVKLRLKD